MKTRFAPDRGLSRRMVMTSFLLGLLYVAFVAPLLLAQTLLNLLLQADLTLLRRFATEAAREEARMFCEQLVEMPEPEPLMHYDSVPGERLVAA